MKVYVVEFGEYSSRYVSGVYSTEERANVAAAPDGDVTEYELDEAFDLYDKGLRPFYVEMAHDGTVVKVDKSEYRADAKPHCYISSTDNFPAKPYDELGWNRITVTTWAKDEQHATKIANEHRAEYVAKGWNGVDRFTLSKQPDQVG